MVLKRDWESINVAFDYLISLASFWMAGKATVSRSSAVLNACNLDRLTCIARSRDGTQWSTFRHLREDSLAERDGIYTPMALVCR